MKYTTGLNEYKENGASRGFGYAGNFGITGCGENRHLRPAKNVTLYPKPTTDL